MISPKGAISPLATARISTGTATTTSATTPSHLSTMTPSRGKDVNQPIIKVQPLMYRRFVLFRLRDPTPTQPRTTLFEGLSKTRFPYSQGTATQSPSRMICWSPNAAKTSTISLTSTTAPSGSSQMRITWTGQKLSLSNFTYA